MIDRLIEGIKRTGAPVVAGLDPMLSYIPDYLLKESYAKHGETLKGAAEAVYAYNKAIVDEIYDLIPAVKPQIAFYEQFGTEGMIAFKKTVDYCHDKGLIVIGDIKRGDIGSTSEAYAAGHIGTTKVGENVFKAFDEDFITVNPYLGSDGIMPFTKIAKETGRGLFILVKTSNPSSGEFQDKLIDGSPLYEHIGRKVSEWGEDLVGKHGYSSVGAVVGATYPEIGKTLRKVMPKAFILVPGYGAQGATAKELRPYFDDNGLGAIVNSSRGIICAYKNEKYGCRNPYDFAKASRAAVIDMIDDLKSILN